MLNFHGSESGRFQEATLRAQFTRSPLMSLKRSVRNPTLRLGAPGDKKTQLVLAKHCPLDQLPVSFGGERERMPVEASSALGLEAIDVEALAAATTGRRLAGYVGATQSERTGGAAEAESGDAASE